MEGLITSGCDLYCIGISPESNEKKFLFSVKPGIPAMDALEGAYTLLDNAVNVVRAIPAEDDLPESLKHAVDIMLEQAQAAIYSVITGSN